jgi:hypothetical protein
MTKKILVNGRKVILTDKHFIASGGEGSIYFSGNNAYKIYHDPSKKMLQKTKIAELQTIGNSQVIFPKDIIYSLNGEEIGYTTDFIQNAVPLLKCFNRTFKISNSIDHQMICELVKWMQLITVDIHKANCLIVDYNELNILLMLNNKKLTPFYIDVDSYSTPSYKATAIMDSVRDRKASTFNKTGEMCYNPTIYSDWFSWAILSFWLYSNIHAFRGNHPKYPPEDKQKQMDDGISVFHPNVRVPRTVENFNVIPTRHLNWYKEVFLNGERSVPPLPDSISPIVVSPQIITITGTNEIQVEELYAFKHPVLNFQRFFGVDYIITTKSIYSGNHEVRQVNNLVSGVFSRSNDGSIILTSKQENYVKFEKFPGGTIEIDKLISSGMFERNGLVYTISNSSLLEHTFISINGKYINKMVRLENISESSSTIYSGCVIQNLLGKKYITIPYTQGKSFSKYIPNLDTIRIIEAKSEKNIAIILGEERGKYNRYILIFNKDYSSYELRVEKDITCDPINFAVLDNGLCLMVSNQNQLQLFADNKKYEIINNPPFDASMPLISTSSGFLFININVIYKISKKK